jgi:hypothetical protein
MLLTGTIGQNIQNDHFGALFRAHSARKWSFDFGTYQLIVPALNLKT